MSAETNELRTLTNEPADDSEFTDGELEAIIAAKGSMNKSAAHVWRIKAGRYADLVNITEGSSSRSWSDAYKQALEMAKMFDKQADDETPSTGRPTALSRKITRS